MFMKLNGFDSERTLLNENPLDADILNN